MMLNVTLMLVIKVVGEAFSPGASRHVSSLANFGLFHFDHPLDGLDR